MAAKGSAGKADVTISGGTIEASSESGADIGGGDSTTNQGGSASITVENAALVELTGGIGGGNSTLSETTGNGGYASVTVTGGTLKTQGKVGGGSGAGSGSGGNASVSISGGTLICASIGGGDTTSGIPGSVTA